MRQKTERKLERGTLLFLPHHFACFDGRDSGDDREVSAPQVLPFMTSNSERQICSFQYLRDGKCKNKRKKTEVIYINPTVQFSWDSCASHYRLALPTTWPFSTTLNHLGDDYPEQSIQQSPPPSHRHEIPR